jgi:hypothetical protein
MDLGQQSNLGSLVSAVLVGLLALASNEFVRMDRSTLSTFLGEFQGRAQVVEAESPVDQLELATQRTQAQIAEIDSIYHGYDPRHPREGELTQKLEQFARDNPDDTVGVFLYLLISRELHDAGQRDVAERILRKGIRVYQDFPQNIGRLTLLNELMDQRMYK